ncbi:MAG: hypothetical protein K940chlam8_00118 [Chlamydiae bacterium]|nr:hypothetical protein [Chlamydiota bacterium]
MFNLTTRYEFYKSNLNGTHLSQTAEEGDYDDEVKTSFGVKAGAVALACLSLLPRGAVQNKAMIGIMGCFLPKQPKAEAVKTDSIGKRIFSWISEKVYGTPEQQTAKAEEKDAKKMHAEIEKARADSQAAKTKKIKEETAAEKSAAVAETKAMKTGRQALEKEIDRFVKELDFKQFKSIEEMAEVARTVFYTEGAANISSAITSEMNVLKEARFSGKSVSDFMTDKELELHILGKVINQYYGIEDGKAVYFILQAYVKAKCDKSTDFHIALYEQVDGDHPAESRAKQAVESVTKTVEKELAQYISSGKAKAKLSAIFADFAVGSQQLLDTGNFSKIAHSQKTLDHPALFALATLKEAQKTRGELLDGSFADVMTALDALKGEARVLQAVHNFVIAADEASQELHAALDPKLRAAGTLEREFGSVEDLRQLLEIEKALKAGVKKSFSQATGTLEAVTTQQKLVRPIYNALFGTGILMRAKGSTRQAQFASYFDEDGKVKSAHEHDFLRSKKEFVAALKGIEGVNFDALIADDADALIADDAIDHLKLLLLELRAEETTSTRKEEIIYEIFVRETVKMAGTPVTLAELVEQKKQAVDLSVQNANKAFRNAQEGVAFHSKECASKQKEYDAAKAKLLKAQAAFITANDARGIIISVEKSLEQNHNAQISEIAAGYAQRLVALEETVEEASAEWREATDRVVLASVEVDMAAEDATDADQISTGYLATAILRRSDEIYQDAQQFAAPEGKIEFDVPAVVVEEEIGADALDEE